jgi:hypothetical protein
MGQPYHVNHDNSAQAESVPGEVKHLSTQRKGEQSYPPSSGERKGRSLNQSSSLLLGRGNRDSTPKNLNFDPFGRDSSF